jgi:signal transduction histidine kinase
VTSTELSWFKRWCGDGAEPREDLTALRIVRQRPWFMSAAAAANFVLLRLAGFPTRRFVILLAIAAIPLAIGFFNAFQARTASNLREGLWRSLFASDVFVPALVIVTGGLRSPLVPILLANVIITIALWRQLPSARLLLAAFALTTCVAMALPVRVTGPAIASPYFELMMGINLIGALHLAVHTILGVSERFISTKRILHGVRERMLEAAAQRVRSLEQVGSKVAHELKNPLAAIKSLLQLELHAAGDERSRRRFEVMTTEVARMEAVLRDYLSFARPLEDLRVGSVDLASVAENVVVLLEGRAAAAGVRLERAGGPVTMGGDARRLEEALLNLAANAIEATPAGGEVTIRTERQAGSGVIVVRDTGKGMDEAILLKLGTPFFTTRKDGTGLGVVLARAALAQHGGRLEFSSSPGEGTTATLTLPDCVRTSGAISDGQIHGPHPAG